MTSDMKLQATASLLRRGASLDHLSTGLTLLGAALGLSQYLLASLGGWAVTGSIALLLLGLLQKYWALRVAFDAELFHCVANLEQPLDQRGESLDQALIALGLQSAARGGRPWSERIRGALNLLRRQALLMALQVLVVVGLILTGFY
ncbi:MULTISPECIES: hypothetical protein [Pseudomonas]|jgi:hypothetical protein|uniref:hypothetical protein n=1 Tax=Pseudomonas TaxID=286 RepID=UPI0004872221|nr:MULTISPECIES: hypothetical protein [Pseudomonas]PRA49362.1 hypothetical protein CQZ98_20505 [Pseudomonas sp. MYb115]QXN48410.1 hypothetical protein KW062_19190 [Pseudomonas fluorescens]WSO22719.1 hypothetical protein VUJ50_19325 [Pseudomonas fluorescens]